MQSEARVSGKPQIALSVDAPPDLVIEVDINSPSLNKLPVYAQIGVPEVWRYDGVRLEILRLESTEYVAVTTSTTLPPLTSSVLSDLVEKSKTTKRRAWIREVREWAQSNAGKSG